MKRKYFICRNKLEQSLKAKIWKVVALWLLDSHSDHCFSWLLQTVEGTIGSHHFLFLVVVCSFLYGNNNSKTKTKDETDTPSIEEKSSGVDAGGVQLNTAPTSQQHASAHYNYNGFTGLTHLDLFVLEQQMQEQVVCLKIFVLKKTYKF